MWSNNVSFPKMQIEHSIPFCVWSLPNSSPLKHLALHLSVMGVNPRRKKRPPQPNSHSHSFDESTSIKGHHFTYCAIILAYQTDLIWIIASRRLGCAAGYNSETCNKKKSSADSYSCDGVSGNLWKICTLIGSKNSFFSASTGVIRGHHPPCFLPSIFLLASTIFILSFTCKCPLPPPSWQQISKPMKEGRQRLHPISVEWCRTCAEMHITLKCGNPSASELLQAFVAPQDHEDFTRLMLSISKCAY